MEVKTKKMIEMQDIIIGLISGGIFAGCLILRIRQYRRDKRDTELGDVLR